MKIHMKPLLSVCVNHPCEVSTHMGFDCFHITLVLFCWGAKIHDQNYSFHQVFPAYGHLDSDNTFGHAAGMKAIDLAMPLAGEYSVVAIAVRNSSHTRPWQVSLSGLHGRDILLLLTLMHWYLTMVIKEFILGQIRFVLPFLEKRQNVLFGYGSNDDLLE